MTKNKKYYYGLMLIVVIFLVLLFRDCTFPKGGSLGTSKNIDESKYIGAYICRYIPEKHNMLIDNKFIFIFNEVWLERTWFYSENYRYPEFEPLSSCYFAFVISTGYNNLGEHGVSWNFEKFNNQYVDPKDGNIISRRLSQNEYKDTIVIRINKLNSKTNEFTDSIGTVRFFKVK